MINGKSLWKQVLGTAFNQNSVFFTPQKRDRWASEATNLPTYLVRLVLKIFFARPLSGVQKTFSEHQP